MFLIILDWGILDALYHTIEPSAQTRQVFPIFVFRQLTEEKKDDLNHSSLNLLSVF